MRKTRFGERVSNFKDVDDPEPRAWRAGRHLQSKQRGRTGCRAHTQFTLAASESRGQTRQARGVAGWPSVDWPPMDEAEKRRRIAQAHEEGRCPNCWDSTKPGGGCGPGRLSDGIFCGLDCQVAFHQDYYRERLRTSRPSPN